jgi:hypothetical protein
MDGIDLALNSRLMESRGLTTSHLVIAKTTENFTLSLKVFDGRIAAN